MCGSSARCGRRLSSSDSKQSKFRGMDLSGAIQFAGSAEGYTHRDNIPRRWSSFHDRGSHYRLRLYIHNTLNFYIMSIYHIKNYPNDDESPADVSRLRQSVWAALEATLLVDESLHRLQEASKLLPVLNLDIFMESFQRATRIEIRPSSTLNNRLYQVRVTVHPTILKDGFIDRLTHKVSSLMRQRSPNTPATLDFLDDIAKSSTAMTVQFTYDNQQAKVLTVRDVTEHKPAKWLHKLVHTAITSMNNSIFYCAPSTEGHAHCKETTDE